jgi:pimeloyl-ACP methyl ester carboxylesterase
MEAVRGETIEVQGLRIHCLSAGSAGLPVMLLHGGGTDSASLSWEPFLRYIAPGHPVFACDWPGYGDSDKPDVEYTTEYYVDFLGHLMDALSLKRASLAGLSMGGGIALGFTLKWSQRVNKLVLVDSYGLQTVTPYGRMGYLLVHMPLINELTWAMIARSRSLTHTSVQALFYNPHAVPGFDALVNELFQELKKPGAGKAWRSYQKSELLPHGPRTVFVDRLREIRAPTLIVHGGEDKLVPVECARQAHRLIEGSELVVIPDCGHWPQREKPEEFNQVVAGFLVDDQ